MVLQFANVTASRKDLFNALAQAYNEIYIPAFPDKNERESLNHIHSMMNGEKPGVRVIVNLAGHNLTSDAGDRVMKGIALAYHFSPANVGLLAYNAVSPHSKGEGIGKILVHTRIEFLKQISAQNRSRLRAVFVECHDPAKVSIQNDCMDPAARIKIFTAWGAREVLKDYVQPPLDKDLEYCDKLSLYNYPIYNKYAGPKEISDFIDAMYKKYLPGEDTKKNPHFQAMMQELKKNPPANDNNRQAIKPLLDRRSAKSLVFI